MSLFGGREYNCHVVFWVREPSGQPSGPVLKHTCYKKIRPLFPPSNPAKTIPRFADFVLFIKNLFTSSYTTFLALINYKTRLIIYSMPKPQFHSYHRGAYYAGGFSGARSRRNSTVSARSEDLRRPQPLGLTRPTACAARFFGTLLRYTGPFRVSESVVFLLPPQFFTCGFRQGRNTLKGRRFMI